MTVLIPERESSPQGSRFIASIIDSEPPGGSAGALARANADLEGSKTPKRGAGGGDHERSSQRSAIRAGNKLAVPASEDGANAVQVPLFSWQRRQSHDPGKPVNGGPGRGYLTALRWDSTAVKGKTLGGYG